MDKRTILAVLLSMMVIIVWHSLFLPSSQPVANKSLTTNSQNISSPTGVAQALKPSTAGIVPELDKEAVLVKEKISFDEVEFDLNLPAGFIDSIYMPDYKHSFTLDKALLLFSQRPMYFVASKQGVLDITHEDDQLTIVQNFRKTDLKYIWKWQIVLTNKTEQSINENFKAILGDIKPIKDQTASRLSEISVLSDSGIIRQSPFGNLHSFTGNFKAISFRDQYFCTVLEPEFIGSAPFLTYNKEKRESALGIDLGKLTLEPNTKMVREFTVYLGPQDATYLNKMGSEYEQVISFGKLDFIAKIMLWILSIGFKITGNWGLAILLFSIVIFFALFPFSLKQMSSMRRMQELQPKMNAIRQQYKDNPQKLNQEIMELYKKEKVNPLGGCLPLVFQLPVFFALYQVLMRSINLKNAHFLWIKDLASPDKAFVIAGFSINILPIFMGILMFFQQKSTQVASSAQDSMAEQQKIMMYTFPIVFTFIFYNFPSGLVMYWATNTLLNLFFQKKIVNKT